MFRFRSAKADGVTIDEIDGLMPEQVKLFAERGLVFSTEFERDGKRHAGTIIAASAGAASEIAAERGLGEEIVGQFVAESRQ